MQWDAEKITGFDWDHGNLLKNLVKHSVPGDEAEQIFSNAPLKVLFDAAHSKKELRFHAYGRTNDGRLLTVTFTERETLMRIISARPMSRKEKIYYEKI